MLLSLNDDCLRLVIKKLQLEDQISCFYACERLKIITTEIWKPKKNQRIVIKDFKGFRKEYLVEYARCISDNVKDLHLLFVNLNHLKYIKFAKVHTLWYLNFESYRNNEKLIKPLFPKLTSLRLGGNFTGKYLRNLTNLETLEFRNCKYLRVGHFENIYSNLRKIKKLSFTFDLKYQTQQVNYNLLKRIFHCETVEEISINDYNLLMIHDDLFRLKKLRKINFLCDNCANKFLDSIITKFDNVLHTVMIAERYRGLEDDFCQSILKIVGLRKLIFHRTNIKKDHFQAMGSSLCSTLEEFYHRDAYYFYRSDYDGALEIVKQSKKLKFFDVTGTDVDLNFVKKVAAIIASDDDEERNQVLVMNCSRTRVKIKDLKTLRLPEKLQISFEYKKLILPTVCYAPFAFVTWERNTTDENN